MPKINLHTFSGTDHDDFTHDEFEKAFSGCTVLSEEALAKFDADLETRMQKGQTSALSTEEAETLEKAYRDRSKLVKKIVIDKNGKRTTKWVKMDDAHSEPEKKEAREELTYLKDNMGKKDDWNHPNGTLVSGVTPSGGFPFTGTITSTLYGGQRYNVSYDGGGSGTYDHRELKVLGLQKHPSGLEVGNLVSSKNGKPFMVNKIEGDTISGIEHGINTSYDINHLYYGGTDKKIIPDVKTYSKDQLKAIGISNDILRSLKGNTKDGKPVFARVSSGVGYKISASGVERYTVEIMRQDQETEEAPKADPPKDSNKMYDINDINKLFPKHITHLAVSVMKNGMSASGRGNDGVDYVIKNVNGSYSITPETKTDANLLDSDTQKRMADFDKKTATKVNDILSKKDDWLDADNKKHDDFKGKIAEQMTQAQARHQHQMMIQRMGRTASLAAIAKKFGTDIADSIRSKHDAPVAAVEKKEPKPKSSYDVKVPYNETDAYGTLKSLEGYTKAPEGTKLEVGHVILSASPYGRSAKRIMRETSTRLYTKNNDVSERAWRKDNTGKLKYIGQESLSNMVHTHYIPKK